MSAPPMPQGPFAVPTFKEFVPRIWHPWIYIFLAITFQLTGGIYGGAIPAMVGDLSVWREDIQMCLYCNLAGMALTFPILFRLKFRFTNRTLLLTALWGCLLCNLAVTQVRCIPLLWLICFLEGVFKIMGTFECLSTIQLWMTKERDFRVFFPIIHIIILNAILFSAWASMWFCEHADWTYMHWAIAGLMLFNLLWFFFTTRHFRFMRPMPFFGLDWTGIVLWVVLSLQLAGFFCYFETLDGWHSPIIRLLAGTCCITLSFLFGRMHAIRHPYIDPVIWRFHPNFIALLVVCCVIEFLLGAEHVLEEVYYTECLHYEHSTILNLNWICMGGVTTGCLFSFWWMKLRHYTYFRLVMVGIALIGIYFVSFYFLINPLLNIEQLYFPLFVRGMASAVTGIAIITALHDMMSFITFFQALAMFQIVHMIMGGVLGGAFYARMLNYLMADNMSRYGIYVDRMFESAGPQSLATYMPQFVGDVLQVTLKQIYGLMAIVSIAFLLLALLREWPARKSVARMQSWKSVGEKMRQQFFAH